jgi:hypothetical protein
VPYSRPTPTTEDLKQGGNHLLYEVQMLSNAAALLEDDSRWNKGWGWESKTLYMVTLESFLTHARSLTDFVCPPSKWEKQTINERGIFAADYCTRPWKPQPWGSMRADHKAISKEIEHLTFDRPYMGRNWPYAAMRDKLKEMLLAFLVEADLLSNHVKDQLRGVLVDGSHVSVADTGVPGIAISTASITAITGVSGATTALIASTQTEPQDP